jgi:hypothetical protein
MAAMSKRVIKIGKTALCPLFFIVVDCVDWRKRLMSKITDFVIAANAEKENNEQQNSN